MAPGNIIGGKYRLVRQIGEGAMGVVWAAVNELTSGEVALKLILYSTEVLRLRLLREARACGGLKHRNIIEVHDVGETREGDPFLVMQLLHGETLAALLRRRRRLDPAVAAQIGRDVARALAAAHAAGVIHRDLKPANIFLHEEAGADEATVKVLDFGVSKSLAWSDGLVTVDGGTIGSPAYMSPEQARTDRDLDPRSDLWSLGVVLFEMLTGVRPFQGDANQVIPRILVGEIPKVSHYVRLVDPGLVELVSRCLTRDRARRVGSAAELAEALQRYMKGEGAWSTWPGVTASTVASPPVEQGSATTSLPATAAVLSATVPAVHPLVAVLQRSPVGKKVIRAAVAGGVVLFGLGAYHVRGGPPAMAARERSHATMPSPSPVVVEEAAPPTLAPSLPAEIQAPPAKTATPTVPPPLLVKPRGKVVVKPSPKASTKPDWLP